MSHTVFLAAGYGLTWAAFLAYLLHLRKREREVRREGSRSTR